MLILQPLQLPARNGISTLMAAFKAPLLIMASQKDIFFPADRVFAKTRKIFTGPVTTAEIDSKHLPSDQVMVEVCKRAKDFFISGDNYEISDR
jgi:hypothetical protein